jgi:aminopeptidase N
MRYLIWLLLFQVSAVFGQQNFSTCQSSKKYLPLRGGDVVTDPANRRSDTLDVLNCDISLNLRQMSTQFISGNCRITLVALLPDVSTIHLDLLGLTVDSVYTEAASLNFGQSGESLFVYPYVPLQQGDTLSINVSYSGNPGQDNSWGGFYFASGYAYNLGVGFDAFPHNFGRVWFPCFDNFVERSTFDFHVLTGDTKQAYCNGIRTGVEDIGEDSLLTNWQLSQEIPTYLAGIAVAGYTHASIPYQSVSGDEIPMWLTALPGDTTNMKLSFTHLDEAMQTFEDHFGAYRWPKVGFSAVPFNAGAMEHATCIAYPKSLLDGTTSYETLMAHELSHHWWGDLVTCRTAEDMWLNEGWASFCEMLFTEALYGEEAYREAARDNHKDVLLYAHRRDGGRYAVSNIPLNITYGDHVYNKGADIARTLRTFMGDQDFFEACTALMTERAFSDISSEDLRDFFQTYTPLDLTAFFDQWVFSPGFPEFRIQQWAVVGGNTVELEVKQYSHYSDGFYSAVPLLLTMWDAQWNMFSTPITAGNESTVLQVQLPEGFGPVHTALNTDDKMALAALSQEKTIVNNGPNDCDYAEMDIVVSDLAEGDTVRVHVENHWAQADESLVQGDYYISPDRWWRVYRSADNATLQATIRYYGDSTQTKYFDPLFFDYVSSVGYNEDSIVLLHRPDPSQPWMLFPDYERITTPGIDNWQGRIRIGNLLSGQYTWAVPRSPLTQQENVSGGVRVVAAQGKLRGFGLDEFATVSITDNSGRLVYVGECAFEFELDTSKWQTGVYHLHIGSEQMNRIHALKVYIP